MIEITLLATDWSGVVSDDRQPVYQANMALLVQFGKPTFPFEDWLPRTRLSAAEFLVDHGITEDPNHLNRLFKAEYERTVSSGIVPTAYPDAAEVLQFLHGAGFPIYVISSHPEENSRKEAQNYGVKRYLRSVLGSTRNKAEGLATLCESAGVNPQKVLYLGDTVYDIQAAKQAGVRSAGISTGYHLAERLAAENPDVLLPNLTKLKEAIRLGA